MLGSSYRQTSNISHIKSQYLNYGQEIGNDVICFKQLEPVDSGVSKNFTCSPDIVGSWISVNKSIGDFEFVGSAFPRNTRIWW